MLAPEFLTQLLTLRPDIVRFLAARRRRRPIRADADDVAQETFAQIMSSAPSYRRDVGELLPWVLGIALNVHRRFVRTEQRYANCFSDQCLNADTYEVSEPSPERCAQLQEARGKVADVIREMPSKQYVVLYMHVVDGLGHAEIASELSISEALSKKTVQRAREWLAQRGLDERTFFSVPPPFVEINAASKDRTAWWREFYDWTFRIGHFGSLLVALAMACAIPGKPIAFAQAGLRVPDITIGAGSPATNPDEPVRNVDTAPQNVELVLRSVPTARPNRHVDKPALVKLNAKPYDLALLVRKNPSTK